MVLALGVRLLWCVDHRILLHQDEVVPQEQPADCEYGSIGRDWHECVVVSEAAPCRSLIADVAEPLPASRFVRLPLEQRVNLRRQRGEH